MAKSKDPVNPFLEENFNEIGGIWSNKVITFVKASAKSGYLGSPDNPFLDADGQKVVQNFISVVGSAEELAFEREERYSVGPTLYPTDDGEGFLDVKTKAPKGFSPNSHAAEFARSLNASGFDVKLLWDEKEQRTKLSKLAGAQFTMRAVQKKDKAGNPKNNKKGFPDYIFYPDKYVGTKVGFANPQPATNELRDKAIAILTNALTAAGGTLTRIAAIKAIQATGDPDTNKIIALIGTQDFHKGQAWKVDSNGYSLI